MAIANYYVGDLNNIGQQMANDRALSAQERIAMAQATADAIRQMGLQRSRNQDNAAARAEQRYATDSDMALRRELAKATLGQSAEARAEMKRQFDETQRVGGERATALTQFNRDKLANDLQIATLQAEAEKSRYSGFPTQALAPQIRAQQDVDEWNTTAKALEANLNTRLEFLDAQEAKDFETEDGFFTSKETARRVAAEKRAVAERALFDGLEGSADYVLPVVDPTTGRRRFKANLRTPPPMPNFGQQPTPVPAPVIAPQPQAAAPVAIDPRAALAAVTNASPAIAGPPPSIANAIAQAAMPRMAPETNTFSTNLSAALTPPAPVATNFSPFVPPAPSPYNPAARLETTEERRLREQAQRMAMLRAQRLRESQRPPIAQASTIFNSEEEARAANIPPNVPFFLRQPNGQIVQAEWYF